VSGQSRGYQPSINSVGTQLLKSISLRYPSRRAGATEPAPTRTACRTQYIRAVSAVSTVSPPYQPRSLGVRSIWNLSCPYDRRWRDISPTQWELMKLMTATSTLRRIYRYRVEFLRQPRMKPFEAQLASYLSRIGNALSI
jgi:hypothetical protein